MRGIRRVIVVGIRRVRRGLDGQRGRSSRIFGGCSPKIVRGLFHQTGRCSWLCSVKNIMYGFGDDRNPASDTVNVMEEILIEYITDVVRLLSSSLVHMLTACVAVSSGKRATAKATAGGGGFAQSAGPTCRCEKTGAYGGAHIHARGHQACACTVRGV